MSNILNQTVSSDISFLCRTGSSCRKSEGQTSFSRQMAISDASETSDWFIRNVSCRTLALNLANLTIK